MTKKMTNWYGWAGTILNIDLTNLKVSQEKLSREFATKYIGASGFGARILYDEVGPGNNALEPENVIIVGQGPLSATAAPSGGRYDLIGKSPLTGIFLRSSGGGFFGPELRWAGYDLIVIRGKAEKPVYLWIKDERVELRDATHLWGQDTWTTHQMIRQELGDPDIQVLKIGPAGENMGYCSCVVGNLGRVAGNYSMAAVWGSKNLKAIAVRGNKAVSVAKPKEFIELCRALTERINNDPMNEFHSRYGTLGTVAGPSPRVAHPDPELWGRRLKDASGQPNVLRYTDWDPYFDKNRSCFACAVHCSHYYSIKSGKYKGIAGEGLQAGCVSGALPLSGDPAFILKYTNLCNQLGLSTMEAGPAIRWAVSQYQNGAITKEDTEGLELTWGNEELFLKLLPKIAYKEGFGKMLDDIYALNREEVRGAGLSAMHTTLGSGVATRDYLTGSPIVTMLGLHPWHEGLYEKWGRERYNDPTLFLNQYSPDPKKALHVWDMENVCTLCDMTGVCKYPAQWWYYDKGWGMEDFAQLLSTGTGVDFSVADLNNAAERELLLERTFNAREGIRRIDNYPAAFKYKLKYGKEHPNIDYSKLPFSIEDYDKVLDEYYRLRGCDREGIPTRERLEYLGLKNVADDLERRGLCPR